MQIQVRTEELTLTIEVDEKKRYGRGQLSPEEARWMKDFDREELERFAHIACNLLQGAMWMGLDEPKALELIITILKQAAAQMAEYLRDKKHSGPGVSATTLLLS